MLAYIARRLLLMLPTLLGILTITFAVMQFVPGGPVDQLVSNLRHGGGRGEVGTSYRAAQDVSPDQIARIRKMYGFDQPPLTRYGQMLSHYARLDLGDSLMNSQPVWPLIKSKLPVTVSLGAWTFVLAYLISIPLGIAKAVHHGSPFDLLSTLTVLVGFAIPGFVLGLVLIVLFASGSWVAWFPLRGMMSDDWQALSWPARVGDYFWHLALPLLCFVIEQFAILTLLTKNTFLEEMRKQYVLVARARGLYERRILYKHIFRNALLPLITGLPGAVVAALLGGDILIESLFSLDGIGLLSYESVIHRDFPVVLGLLFISTLLGLAIKLICDLLYVAIDPRLHFGRAAR